MSSLSLLVLGLIVCSNWLTLFPFILTAASLIAAAGTNNSNNHFQLLSFPFDLFNSDVDGVGVDNWIKIEVTNKTNKKQSTEYKTFRIVSLLHVIGGHVCNIYCIESIYFHYHDFL